jgi:hypothetical protein
MGLGKLLMVITRWGKNSIGKGYQKAQNHGFQPKVLHLCTLGTWNKLLNYIPEHNRKMVRLGQKE